MTDRQMHESECPDFFGDITNPHNQQVHNWKNKLRCDNAISKTPKAVAVMIKKEPLTI